MLDRSSQLEDRMEKLGYFLVVIPPLTYWIYWTLNPSYWFNADPAAVYFVNSLSVFAGYSYQFVDHPRHTCTFDRFFFACPHLPVFQ